MCGIAGLCNCGENPAEVLKKMTDLMISRGPDAEGSWHNGDGSVFLGHRRLAIMDLSEDGAQPMVSRSGRYVIVYNGEIYNHQEIREDLLSAGAVSAFCSTCDTEVLLEAIEAYGIVDALRRCRGMFAIGVYDRRSGKIYLARDRIGEKPLYYGFAEGQFFFASDIRCFKQVPGFEAKINSAVLGIYFGHGYIPAPYTIYKDVYKLQPGTILRIEPPYRKFVMDYEASFGGNQRVYAYWSIERAAMHGQTHLFTGSRQEAGEELERLLRRSIRDQMVADVPLGAFLSAGIDSSTVVALMQEENPGQVRTFTIGMEDKAYDEAKVAKEIAAHLGTRHTEQYISEKDAMDVIPLLPDMFGEPFADSSQIPTYLVSKMTRQHVTVSLSGDGGDELFGGYLSYASVSRIWNKMRGISYRLRKPIGSILYHTPLLLNQTKKDKALLLQAMTPEELYRIQMEELNPLIRRIPNSLVPLHYAYDPLPEREGLEVTHRIMLMDMLMYHPDDILTKVDRTAMAVSLETRVPMLDRDVVEFAWTLPAAYLRKDGIGKTVLRDILYKYVPKELVDRPKKGFSVPISRWLRETELKDWAEDLISEDKIRSQGFLNPETVRTLWNRFVVYGDWIPQIWYILIFQQWLEKNAL